MQYCPLGQSRHGSWHGVTPGAQRGTPPHSGGSELLPMQSSHGSHGLKHEGTGSQGLQLVGWPTTASEQSSESSHTKLPLPAGSSQHPKQSHPFGVMGAQ